MASFLQSFVRTNAPSQFPSIRHLSSTYIPFGPSPSSSFLFAAAVTALLLLRRRCHNRRTRTDLGRLCAPQKRKSERHGVCGTDGGDEPMTDCRPGPRKRAQPLFRGSGWGAAAFTGARRKSGGGNGSKEGRRPRPRQATSEGAGGTLNV